MTLLYFGYALAASIILGASTGARHACGDAVWWCVLCLCIINWLLFLRSILVFLANLCGRGGNDDSKNGQGDVIAFVINIWSVIAYFDMSESCQEEFNIHYYHLRQMLLANVILFFVCIGIGVSLCCGLCCYAVCKRHPRQQSAEPVYRAADVIAAMRAAEAQPSQSAYIASRGYQARSAIVDHPRMSVIVPPAAPPIVEPVGSHSNTNAAATTVANVGDEDVIEEGHPRYVHEPTAGTTTNDNHQNAPAREREEGEEGAGEGEPGTV